MNIFPLASSSKGNAFVVEHEGMALLVDHGLTGKRFNELLSACPVTVREWVGVLITHSHVDHVSGLRLFLKRNPDVPVFANIMTAETVSVQEKIDINKFFCFENGQEFNAGAFTVRAFSIPHDTSDPVAYLVKIGDETYFHGTDIGTPLASIGMNFRTATVAILESNHDPVLLHNSGRSPSLIQRIAGERGHLSNDQAAELVRKFAGPHLKCLYLAHLSEDCNSPELALATMRETLAEIGRSDIQLKVVSA